MAKGSDDPKRPLLLLLTICDSAAQSPDGKFTLYGLFNRITVAKLPGGHSELVLFFTFGYGRPGKYTAHFHIASPSGQKLLDSPPLLFELQNEKAICNVQIKLQGFPLPEAGPYRIAVFLGDDTFPLEERILFFVEEGKPKQVA
jgi:hypothetical protein